jgi:hypothetical protein
VAIEHVAEPSGSESSEFDFLFEEVKSLKQDEDDSGLCCTWICHYGTSCCCHATEALSCVTAS